MKTDLSCTILRHTKILISVVVLIIILATLRRKHRTTLFPYTTLFRSALGLGEVDAAYIAVGGKDQSGAENERSEEHTSELQSLRHLVCRLLLEKKKH